MQKSEYKNKYAVFAGYIHDFSDPSGDDSTDEEIARMLRHDWPKADRIAMYKKLIPESGRMLDGIDTEWEAFSLAVNRAFSGPDDARDWLRSVRREFQSELARLM
jgi:hypothetical protein